MTKINLFKKDLVNIYTKLKASMSKEDTRYYLCGVCLDYVHSEKTLYAISTNGHTLSRLTIPDINTDATEDFNIIVPKALILKLKDVKPDKYKKPDHESQKAEISIDENIITITYDMNSISSPLIDGTFPDYRRVIPEEKDMQFTIGFQPQLMIDICTAIKNSGGAVKLQMQDSDSPMLIHEADPNITYVLMPIKF